MSHSERGPIHGWEEVDWQTVEANSTEKSENIIQAWQNEYTEEVIWVMYHKLEGGGKLYEALSVQGGGQPSEPSTIATGTNKENVKREANQERRDATVYTYDELDDEAQEKVLENWQESQRNLPVSVLRDDARRIVRFKIQEDREDMELKSIDEIESFNASRYARGRTGIGVSGSLIFTDDEDREWHVTLSGNGEYRTGADASEWSFPDSSDMSDDEFRDKKSEVEYQVEQVIEEAGEDLVDEWEWRKSEEALKEKAKDEGRLYTEYGDQVGSMYL